MEDRMMSLSELSQIIGVSVRTLRRWFAQKTNPIPIHRVGGRFLRVRRSDVVLWLASLDSSHKPVSPARRDIAD